MYTAQLVTNTVLLLNNLFCHIMGHCSVFRGKESLNSFLNHTLNVSYNINHIGLSTLISFSSVA